MYEVYCEVAHNIGNGTSSEWGDGESTPHRVETEHVFVDAACGMEHNVLLTNANKIVVFGNNAHRQCSTVHRKTSKVLSPLTLSKRDEFDISESHYVEKVLCMERASLLIVDDHKRML